ncbi:MAG: hypothetical protein ACRC5M_00735 [Anaeroplasmataceae bacterium]
MMDIYELLDFGTGSVMCTLDEEDQTDYDKLLEADYYYVDNDGTINDLAISFSTTVEDDGTDMSALTSMYGKHDDFNIEISNDDGTLVYLISLQYI